VEPLLFQAFAYILTQQSVSRATFLLYSAGSGGTRGT
jgi:hypothetical protein